MAKSLAYESAQMQHSEEETSVFYDLEEFCKVPVEIRSEETYSEDSVLL